MSKTSVTLEELLSLRDELFIKSAYQHLLGREHDASGFKYYYDLLKAGKDKIEILTQIRTSTEGKSREVTIHGLDEAVRRHKRLKTPLIGSLLKLAGGNKKSSTKKTAVASTAALDSATPNPQDNQLKIILDKLDFDENILPQSISLEKIHQLNPTEHFENLTEALTALLIQPPIRKLRIHEDELVNAEFYGKLGLKHETLGLLHEATELYRLSLIFASTAFVHEHLGNIAKNKAELSNATLHYEKAINLHSSSEWVYLNLALTYSHNGHTEKGVDTLIKGLIKSPSSDLLLTHLDSLIQNYWSEKEREVTYLAEIQDREQLIVKYDELANYISNAYYKIFMRSSPVAVRPTLNTKRVLIVGLEHGDAPQCYRYRIEQKVEQLESAGYKVETVAWHNLDKAMALISLYDLVIFYRVPAFPGVLKQVAYTRSLGKISFFEVDDLLFETYGVPAIETYGGQVPMHIYTSITKDIGSHRAIARQCDYAISSTLPLLKMLSPLVKTQKGFLHRNGLDKYNQYQQKVQQGKETINLFYGSGTLAHNTDFIIEALPAISKILKQHENVKLVVMGFLTLPEPFLKEFSKQFVQIPFVKDVSMYYSYLSGADISLAVLHDDPLTACKSELKWFEAATFSVPSVVSRTDNYVDVINQGVDGFIVSDEDQWFTVLSDLIENPQLRFNVGQKAYERVISEYSIENLARNIDNILISAVKDHCKN